ncbi:MAG: alkyl hydroperoxide reductase [Bacteroidota bacterium]
MKKYDFPQWMKVVLQLAAIYNILWGAWVGFFPFQFFDWAEMTRPVYSAIWQAVGMIVGCYGLAYWIASYHPFKHWGIVLVGFLGKLFGPIGFVQHFLEGKLPLVFGLHNITNDLIWLIPFGVMLYQAYRGGYVKLKESH